jgi:RNA polymerase sigma factor (sigma-70 family)
MKILSTKPLEEYTEEFLPFFLGNTEGEAEANYEVFSRTLNNIASSYAKFSGLEKEDLFGTALTGLARALRDFDPKRNSNFLMYANYKMRSVLNDYCHKNMAIVSVPSYVALAHGYINRIRNILFKYVGPEGSVKAVILSKKVPNIRMTTKELSTYKGALAHLETLSKNSGVSYDDLIERSEYVPLNVSFEESYLTDEDFEERDVKQIQLTALVSKIRGRMTAKEQSIADGIMLGKTYDEIGAEQKPPRSAAWVRKQLDNIKNRIMKEKD